MADHTVWHTVKATGVKFHGICPKDSMLLVKLKETHFIQIQKRTGKVQQKKTEKHTCQKM